MDRRHGKRPLPSEASKAEEKEVDDFASYESSVSETDVSAMVSALSRVIGTGHHEAVAGASNEEASQPTPDQGT